MRGQETPPLVLATIVVAIVLFMMRAIAPLSTGARLIVDVSVFVLIATCTVLLWRNRL